MQLLLLFYRVVRYFTSLSSFFDVFLCVYTFTAKVVLQSLENDNKTTQKLLKKSQPYFDISASFKILGMNWQLWYWIVDLSHEISNLVKNWLQLVTNKDNTTLQWKKAHRVWEQTIMGRFKNVKCKAPWHLSKTRLQELRWLCTKLKVCKDWPPVTAMFEFENRMKIADCLAFCSDRGLYFIGLMDIDPVYKNNFVAIVRSLNVVLQKSPPKTELERANIDLVQYNFYFIYFTVRTIIYFIFHLFYCTNI
jgi:hypothetical protein